MKKLKTGKDSAVITKEHGDAQAEVEKKQPEKKLKKVVLITGNANKLAEFQQILKGKAELVSKNIDLEEFQGECEEIAKKKVLQAYSKTKRQTVITEDTSLCFNALGGLPGPYIRWFLEGLKPEGLNKMIANFEDKTAYAQCIIGYMDRSLKEPKVFVGRTNGKIVMPRGPNTFGWDPIFEPDGFTQTYSEMEKEQKNKISHRYRAIEKFMEFLDGGEKKDGHNEEKTVEKKEHENGTKKENEEHKEKEGEEKK